MPANLKTPWRLRFLNLKLSRVLLFFLCHSKINILLIEAQREMTSLYQSDYHVTALD